MTGGRSHAASVVVQASGLDKPPWMEKLRGCVVEENVDLPDTAMLVYEDGDRELLATTAVTIGSPVTVSVAVTRTQATERLFRGEVTALEMDVDGTGAYTVVRAMSKAHRLFRGRRVAAFTSMTAADVVRRVARNAGLGVGRVQAAPITYQHLSQPGVSDWDFLQTLAREHGAVVSVDDQGRLEFTRLAPASSAPPPTASAATNPYVLEFGANLMVLRASLSSAELAGGVEVRGWDHVRKQKIVALRKNLRSKSVLPGLSVGVAGAAVGTRNPILVTGTPYTTQAQADAAADALTESVAAGYGELEAVVEGNPKLRAGVPVTLSNAGPAFSGRYTATAVTHAIDPDSGYRTTVLVSASTDRSLAGLTEPADQARMPGLAIGIVTNIKEVGGEHGWVKLKFPWLDDAYETDWVRTVQFGGTRGGGVFSPEVNDEVLVGFDRGSLDRPYVLGGLYNGQDAPSPHDQPLVDGTSGRVNRRSLVSPGGNRVELLDGRRQSGVRVATGDDRLEVVLDERNKSLRLTVRGPGGRLETSSITLDGTGITLDAKTGVVQIKGQLIRLN